MHVRYFNFKSLAFEISLQQLRIKKKKNSKFSEREELNNEKNEMRKFPFLAPTELKISEQESQSY